MTIGIVGRKCGMSRVFTEAGESIPVTLIEASPNRITQLKTVETDGYVAVQVTTGNKRAALVNKPSAGAVLAWTTTHGPALMTVAGWTVPSGSNTCVMPTLRPIMPVTMVFSLWSWSWSLVFGLWSLAKD